MRQRNLFGVFRDNPRCHYMPLCCCFVNRAQRWFVAAGENGEGIGVHGDPRCAYAFMREDEDVRQARLRRRFYQSKRRCRIARTLA